jgi:hypothetical protein
MCGTVFMLMLIGLVIMYSCRSLWDKDYREGLEARRSSDSWNAGWNAGRSGCGGVFLVIVILGCLLAYCHN